MIGKRVQRRIGRRQYLQVESLIQGPGQKLRGGQLRLDGLVVMVRIRRTQPLVQAKEFLERKVQPKPRRCAAKQVVVTSKDAPDFAWIIDPGVPEFQFLQR